MRVPFSYLPEQFADPEPILAEIRKIIATGDFTLGAPVAEFEKRFAALVGCRHAVAVNSGTDALRLALKSFGVGPGDEVITSANTFIATVGAIADLGARPIFVDCAEDFCTDVGQIEAAIGHRTKAIIPVHLTGAMADMTRLHTVAARRGIPVIEDACQAIKSSFEGRPAGSWGQAAAFSLHPLKFLNIWGDGGVITTNDGALAERLQLRRNHGLADRDTVVMLGVNTRLDTLQAVVALNGLAQAEWISTKRRENAAFYDHVLSAIRQIRIPTRDPRTVHSYVTYQILAEERDALLQACIDAGVECKVHYPVPVYLQPGLQHFGYRPGDFPVSDRQASMAITLPVHQYLSADQLSFTVETIARFYGA